MLPDYFLNYLQNYLRDHHFDELVIESDFVKERAEAANDIHDVQMRAGYSLFGATEFALKDLFAGVGESPYDVFTDILEEDFSSIFNSMSQEEQDKLVERLSMETDLLEIYALEDGIGMMPEVKEEMRPEVVSRVGQYLKSYGI